MSNKRQLSYSRALTEIEEIINEIESEEIDLDALADKVKRAADLIKLCKGKLRNIDEEVKKALSEIQEKSEADQE